MISDVYFGYKTNQFLELRYFIERFMFSFIENKVSFEFHTIDVGVL